MAVSTMKSSKSYVHKKGKCWVYFRKSTKNTESEGTTTHDDVGKLNHTNVKPSKKRHKKKKNKDPNQQERKLIDKLPLAGQTKAGSVTEGLPKGNEGGEKVSGSCPSVLRSEKQCAEIDAKTSRQKKKKEKRKLRILKRKHKETEKKGLCSTSNRLAPSSTDGQGPQGISEKVRRKTKGLKRTKDLKGVEGDKVTKDQSGGEGTMTLGRTDNREPGHYESPATDRGEQKVKRKAKKRKLKAEEGNGATGQQDAAKRSKQDLDSGMSSGTQTPILPTEPQDVAANWKALVSKLKPSGSSGKTSKTKKKDNKSGVNKKEEIWFDDVDPALLETEKMSSGGGGGGAGKEKSVTQNAGDGETEEAKSNQITKCVALDCEMVGIGHEGKDSILARVSMVNEYGQCIYDKFVKPREKVTDYRTAVSGVRPSDLFKGSAEEFLAVQKEVAAILKDRILVGHALRNDMKVLYLGHPRRLVRDTATYAPFRELMKTKRPALRKLAKTVLGVTIQEGEHSSVEDARTAMRLYTLHRTAWEKTVKHKSRKLASD